MRHLLTALLLTATLASAQAASAATVLITGSNRGLGFEFAKQYAEAGWDVIATCRSPERADALKALAGQHKNISIEELDILDQEEINSLAEKYKGRPIDILINNAGILGDVPKQTFGNVDRSTFNRIMDTNVYGAIAVTEAFRDNIVASNEKKIIALTSLLGSTSAAGPGYTFYRASKAALSMSMRVIGGHMRREGVVVGVVAPCVAQTDMLKEFGYEGPMTVSAETAVKGMRGVIADLTSENNSKPINCDGKPFEW